MRKVTRGAVPPVLIRNGHRWTSELLEMITANGKFDKDARRYINQNRYNHSEIKTALEQMYGSYCGYCESDYRKTGYSRIDHRQPAAQFHDQSFNWFNLHLSCERCNGEKSDQWDAINPILDPVNDDPELHLHPNIISGEINALTDRGTTTIIHTKLCRDSLVMARRRVADGFRELILMAHQQNNTALKGKLFHDINQLLQPDPATGLIDTEYTLLLKELLRVYGGHLQ